MVAKITIGKSLANSFYYNENKVKEGVACCLLAQNYPMTLELMQPRQKLRVLQHIAALRERVAANSIHISLNFDPSEQLSEPQLKAIVQRYMQGIGFGQQPYLVYQHLDAGHPHIHIVSTRITLQGQAINVHNIAKERSEPTRKAIETEFELVPAEGLKNAAYQLPSAFAEKVVYGKTASKKAIENVLREVINKYKYASLPELNAALKAYNVMADRGNEQSRTYQRNGLYYRILDHQGQPVGVPIKASLFPHKPTLKYLQERFIINETARQPFKTKLKNAVDLYFLQSKRPSLANMVKQLEKQSIQLVLRQNEQGFIYGITYVDHKNKCVFNGSAVGKNYSAQAIQERCLTVPSKPTTHSAEQSQPINQDPLSSVETAPKTILEDLLEQERGTDYVPYELRGKKKRRRKGRSQ